MPFLMPRHLAAILLAAILTGASVLPRTPTIDPANLFPLEVGAETLYIDPATGRTVLRVNGHGDRFHEGLARVYLHDPFRCRYLRPDGRVAFEYVFKTESDHANSFHEGRASFCVNEKYGLFDRRGNVIVPPRFWVTNDFRDGMAVAYIGEWDTPSLKCGFINRNGEWVIPPQFIDAEDFFDGVAAVIRSNPEGTERISFIDLKGRPIGSKNWPRWNKWSLGWDFGRLVTLENGEACLVDGHGNRRSTSGFTWYRYVPDGIVAATVEHNSGLRAFGNIPVDRNGRPLDNYEFDRIKWHSDGVFCEKSRGYYRYRDVRGKLLLERADSESEPTPGCLARIVDTDGTRGGLHRDGRFLPMIDAPRVVAHGVIDDEWQGLTEAEVLQRFGKPTREILKPLSERILIGVTVALGSKLPVARHQEPIRELSYTDTLPHRYFWLARAGDGWKVFSSLSFEEGIVF